MLSRTLLLSLSACSALTVQVDEPRLCQSLPAVVIPALGDGGAASGSTALSIPVDLPAALSGAQALSIELSEVSLATAPDGGTPGVLTRASATLSDPTSGAPVVIVDEQLSTDAPQPNPLVLEARSANLAPYLQSGALQVQLALQGELPAEAWSLTAEVCFHVSATIDYADPAAPSN